MQRTVMLCTFIKSTFIATTLRWILKISFVSLCFSFSSVIAASLEVQVLEKGTGQLLEGATVVLGESGDYGETSKKGIVTFEDPELPVKLKILNMGFDTQEVDVSQNQSKINVYLLPISIEGDVLEVVAERVKEKTSKIVISKEELKRAPGSQGDPLKTIQSMPGVVTATEGAGLVYIRGSEPNQNITWVNRAQIGYLYHFGGLHSTISPQLVSDFNMFLGGYPVEYGDSLGGALDVKLRSPKKDRLHQVYSVGTYEASAVIEGPLFKKNGKDSAYISARRSYVDLILSEKAFTKVFNSSGDGDEEDEVTEVPRFYDVQGVWQHDVKNGRVLLQHFSARDSIELVLNTPKGSDPDAVGTLASSIEYHSTSVIWEQMWTKDINTSSSMYIIDTSQSLQIGNDGKGNPYFLNIDEIDLVWQPELRWSVNESTLLTFGSDFIYARTPVDAYISRPPQFNDPDYNLTELEKFRVDQTYHSALFNPYFKVRKKWFNRLSTQLGMRARYMKSDGREDILSVSPRSSVEYDLTKQTILTGSWGRYVQMPEGAQWIREAGNPELKNLDSEHRIVGVRHKINPTWNIQVEAYHKPMKDLVVTYDDPKPNNYKNDGKGEAYGFDILIKREFSGKKMGWLSYSALRSTRTENGVTVPFSGDQRHTFTMVWSQPMLNTWNKWIMGFRLRANSGKPYTKVLSRTGICEHTPDVFSDCADQPNAESDMDFSHWVPNRGSTNGSRLPNFFQLDVRVDREVLYNTWKMNYYIDILNILNIQNISGYDYGDSFDKIENPTKTKSLGIFPSIGVEATF